MKARIKGTGEVIGVNAVREFDGPIMGYIKHGTNSYFNKDDLELIDIDWEQRRYEISKDILSNQIVASVLDKCVCTDANAAKQAIELADELIKQLKGE